MRTICIAIAGLLLSLAVVTTASASPFTAIGLPLVYGQEAPQPTQTTNWWLSVVQSAIDQLRVLATPRIVVDEASQAK
jgi:hypothetical protein